MFYAYLMMAGVISGLLLAWKQDACAHLLRQFLQACKPYRWHIHGTTWAFVAAFLGLVWLDGGVEALKDVGMDALAVTVGSIAGIVLSILWLSFGGQKETPEEYRARRGWTWG